MSMSLRSLCRRLRDMVIVSVLAMALSPLPAARAQQELGSGVAVLEEEKEALKELRASHLVSARTKAEKALDKNPDSIVGHYVLGISMKDSEGDLARAMNLLGRARELFEDKFGFQLTDAGPWPFHRELLYAIQNLAGEMDETDYQLRIIDFHNQLYDPDFIAEAAWALLKKRDFPAARAKAEAAIKTNDAWQNTLGINALCAIETEAHEKRRAKEVCLQAVEHEKKTIASVPAPKPGEEPYQTSLSVHLYNAHIAHLGLLEYDKAEAALREASLRREFTIANPWGALARLLATQGRFTDAIAALRDMQTWRQRNPPSLRDQDRARSEANSAVVLLALGEARAGLRIIHRAQEHPDRGGFVSSKPEQAMAANALLASSLEHAVAAEVADTGSVYGTWGRIEHTFSSWGHRYSARLEKERARSVLVSGTLLLDSIRSYLAGGVDLPPWLSIDLVEMIGAGPAEEVLKAARKEETVKGHESLLDAFDCERESLEAPSAVPASCTSAERTLPKEEALLKARTLFNIGKLEARAGVAGALPRYRDAFRIDPALIRRRNFSLPATLSVSGSERLETLLRRSPRFQWSDAGFTVKATASANTIRICIDDLFAAPRCSETERGKKQSDNDLVSEAILDFYAATFRVQSGLTDEDLRLFDGTTSLSQKAQKEKLKEVLEKP